MCVTRPLVVWTNKEVLSVFQGVIFQDSSLTYCIPLVKGQNSFYEILSQAIRINIKTIKTFNRVNRKQLNILKTFLE